MLSVRRLVAIANAALLMLAAADEPRPNVVILTGDFGSKENARLLEPLRASGTSFRNCFGSSQSPKTLASWLTGCHELRAGIVDTVGGRNFIRPAVPLVSDAFKAAGWQTAFFGTWPFGEAIPFRPEDRGFQEVLVDADGRSGDYWGNNPDHPWLRDLKGWSQRDGKRAAVLETETRRWIETRVAAKERFFLMLNLPKGSEGSAKALLEDLDRSGVGANTLVIALGTIARESKETPDALAPLVFRWPGHVAAGRVVETPVAVFDGMPTAAALCGVSLFRDWKGDGIDISGLGKEPRTEPVERSFFFHPGGWPADQVVDRYKSDGYAVRSGKWRLSGLDLLDVSLPPEHRENVFETQPDIAMRMMTDYGIWWQSIRPAFTAPARIIVGDERQPVTPVTWGDWWPSRESTTALGPVRYPDQASLRGLLRELADPARSSSLPSVSGVWKVHANRTGHYKVSVSKLPPGADPAERESLGKLHGGMAHARAGKYEVKTPLLEGATALSLGVDLNEGDADLEVWFEGQGAKDAIFGAFFATIERMGERKMPDPDWKPQTKENGGEK
ncbi:sulfatase-like hydrolase/transferase [Luteolibacter ambystomatis]|uniref:Sulfatase-like hydrolase/transferase n=1 Tax=Luteolibacter ambystomatis TaxID=2824561 RepID=A0A975PGQ9_9BACT|nr:sulfatase-like hydrolase/transferase [Luteolibacter ambystomatis]QUE52557.1 sulfatase-like hydrolase/transferase [Luteolibacter ambystomatis]